MKRAIPLIAFLAAVILTHAALGQVRLRAKVTMLGDVITLGDLFTGTKDLADREIGPAPGPGQRAIYKAEHLAALARAYDLDWRPASRASRSIIHRGGETVGKTEIVELLVAEFRRQGAVGRIKVQLNRLRRDILLSPQGGALRIEELTYDSNGGAFRGYIHGTLPGGKIQRQVLRGRVDFVARIPVPSRSIRRGQEITSADIKWIELNLRLLGSETIEHPDQIIGLAANRNLRQNQPLRPSDLRAPIMIAKGTIVTVSLINGALTVTGTGRALEDGSKGEVIRVMNMQSKRTLDARVVGPNQVKIAPRRLVTMAANR
jgi:flagella basal body P-ring formation protein FlgA